MQIRGGKMKKYVAAAVALIVIVIVGIVFRKRIAINFNDLTEVNSVLYLTKLDDGTYRTENKVILEENYQDITYDVQKIINKVRRSPNRTSDTETSFVGYYEYKFVTDKHELILRFEILDEKTNNLLIYYKELNNEEYQVFKYKNRFVDSLYALKEYFDVN